MTGDRGPGTEDRGPRTGDRGPRTGDLGPRTGDRGPGPETGPILLHGRLWDPHRNNKCQAPVFCSALQNTLVQQLFVNSADEKQETKLLWTICIMHISLQNSELFLAQLQAIIILSQSPHHYSYPVVDAIDAGDQLAKHNSK